MFHLSNIQQGMQILLWNGLWITWKHAGDLPLYSYLNSVISLLRGVDTDTLLVSGQVRHCMPLKEVDRAVQRSLCPDHLVLRGAILS